MVTVYGRRRTMMEFLGLTDRRAGRQPAEQRRRAEVQPDPGEGLGLHAVGRVRLLLVSEARAVLGTLEGYLGEQTMARVMRTYHERWRFRHPRSEDFFALVNEVTGQDWSWYFDQVVRGTDIVDYDIGSASHETRAEPRRRVRRARGTQDGVAGRTPTRRTPRPTQAKKQSSRRSWSCGGAASVHFPVDGGVQVRGQAGRAADLGRARLGRRRSRFERPEKLEWVDVDPDRKVAARRELAEQRQAHHARRRVRRPLGRAMALLRPARHHDAGAAIAPGTGGTSHVGKYQGRACGRRRGTRDSCACFGRGTGCSRSACASRVAVVERRARVLPRRRRR